MAEAQAVTFRWEGTDKRGNKLKGQLVSASEALVKTQLRRQGIKPLKIKKSSGLGAKQRKKPIKPLDIAVFSRQLATMMEAGVPLVQALDMIGRGNENHSMQALVLTIKNHVESGHSLSESLAKHPLYFDALFVNLVDAGERSGALDRLLDKIATYKEKTEALKSKIKKALFYPAAVVAVAIIVTGIMMIFVVPSFQAIFEDFGAELPSFTLMIMHTSEFFQAYWWAMLFGMIGSGMTFSYYKKRSATFNAFLDKISLRLPVVGNILHSAAIARYARTLSTMFAAGVPLVEALHSVAGATGNVVYEKAVMYMKEQVSTGQQLNLAMSQTGLFPSLPTQMIAIGEESGALDNMCAKVADYYEQQVDDAVDGLTSLLEPLIMAFLGILVGGLVVGMYLPVFKMASTI